MSEFKNLSELLNQSSSTRKYFVSLPVQVQCQLHEHDEEIHSAYQLHMMAGILPELEKFR